MLWQPDRSIRVRGIAIAVLACTVCVSCGPDDQDVNGGNEWQQNSYSVASSDSARISIFSYDLQSIQPAPLEVDSVGGTSIIDPAHESLVVLGRLRGATFLANGEIVVVDQLNGRVLFFSFDGELLRSIGGLGHGPGELIQPALVDSCDPSTIAITDWTTHQLSLFDTLGSFRDRATLRSRSGTPQLICQDVIVTRRVVYQPKPGPDQGRTAEYWWLGLDAPQDTALATMAAPGQAVYRAMLRGPEEVTFDAPFDVMPSSAVSISSVLIYDGEEPEIREYGLDGKLRAIHRFIVELAQPTEDVFESWMRAHPTYGNRRGDDFELLFDALKEAPRPPYVPLFEALKSGADGRIWLKLAVPYRTESLSWLVLDVRAPSLAGVRVPSGAEVIAASRDDVLLTWKDEFDRDVVVRRPISKTHSPL